MSLTKSFRTLQFSLLLICGLASPSLWAAACCGGGFAIPSVITGDDLAQMTMNYSYAQIDTDVYDNGIWKKREANENTQILKLEGSHIFQDRYQAGFSIPIEMRSKEGVQNSSSTGLGDIALLTGYEYLPDWDYNPWRPHGVGFISLTLPTGKSVYEMNDPAGLDSRGRGFWALGLGSVLTKTWLRWDANVSFEAHHSFAKDIHSNTIQGTATPGNGGSLTVGTGYNIKDLRLGTAISWTYEDPIRMQGDIPSDGSIQRFATASFNMSYMLPDNWAGTLTYSDQLLFGSPVNTTLSKSVALLFQKRWQR